MRIKLKKPEPFARPGFFLYLRAAVPAIFVIVRVPHAAESAVFDPRILNGPGFVGRDQPEPEDRAHCGFIEPADRMKLLAGM
jgi:hypothetical protein